MGSVPLDSLPTLRPVVVTMDLWRNFSMSIARMEDKYYNTGKEWHAIPPDYRRMFLAWKGPAVRDLDCDYLLMITRTNDSRLRVPMFVQEFHELHIMRDEIRAHMAAGRDEEASDLFRRAQQLLGLSVAPKVAHLPSRVRPHREFYKKVRVAVPPSREQLDQALSGLLLWQATLPGNWKDEGLNLMTSRETVLSANEVFLLERGIVRVKDDLLELARIVAARKNNNSIANNNTADADIDADEDGE